MTRPALLALFIALTLALAGASPAHAEELEVVRGDDGSVTVTGWVDASVQSVRAVLGGPFERGELTDAVDHVDELGASGDCRRLRIVIKVAIATFDYEVRRCDTADGVVEELTGSDTVRAHAAQWVVRPAKGGVQVSLSVQTELELPVPDRLQHSYISKASQDTLAGVLASARRAEQVAGL